MTDLRQGSRREDSRKKKVENRKEKWKLSQRCSVVVLINAVPSDEGKMSCS